jgi:DNA-binding NarL/FixJ family response regulator
VAAPQPLSAAPGARHALLTAGRALAAAGRADDAREHLERAAGLAARHGAGRGEAIAAHGLRRLGVRPRTAPRPARAGAGVRADPGALTPREREIAALVARGSANKEVAATLHLSPKTVEANLSRVYAKLGVRSRTELAALAREGGLTS